MATAASNLHLQVQISYKQILQLALPIAASMIVPQINFITNNIFLGSLGEQPLALAGITGVFYLIFAVIGFGLNNGLQALIARRSGENNVDGIAPLFNQGLRVAMGFALAGILLTYCLAPLIFKISLSSPAHVQLATQFLQIRIWGLPFLYLYQMRNALLVGTNQTKFLIIGTLAETISNIVFDYGLIKGKLGLPALGFNGAAYASIIAEGVGFLSMYLIMRFKGISKQLKLSGHFKYNATVTKSILRQSSPLIVQFMISIISWEYFYILIEHHGERDLAISNTMRNIFGLFGCISWAFAATTNTMVSNIIGQGMSARVIELIIKIMQLSLGIAICVFILINISPGFLLQVYGRGDDFVHAAIPVVRVVSAALMLMSVSTVWLNAVSDTGNTRINLLIEIVAIFIYCLYAWLVLEKLHLTITIAWLSEWIYWISMLIPSFIYIQSGRWKGRVI